MRGEKEPSDVEREDTPIFGMSRRWGMTRNREAMPTPPGKMGYTVLDQKAHRAFIAPGRPRAGAIFVSMEAR